MTIAIITATYNRRNMLPALYDSLVRNKSMYQDFKWYIMDDGSTDDTEEYIHKLKSNHVIEIAYYKQENQGKMAAINHLMPYVEEDITVEVDSDDYLVDDALICIAKDYEALPSGAYGILYQSIITNHENYMDESLDGKVMTLFDMHYKYGYTYDMALTFLTAIKKQYPYELVGKERFITEARTYYKMDQSYEGLLVHTKGIKICAYQCDGYTVNIKRMFLNYPKGYYAYFLELLNYKHHGILLSKRFYMVKHYILFSTLTHVGYVASVSRVKPILNKLLVLLLFLPGKLFTRLKMR